MMKKQAPGIYRTTNFMTQMCLNMRTNLYSDGIFSTFELEQCMYIQYSSLIVSCILFILYPIRA